MLLPCDQCAFCLQRASAADRTNLAGLLEGLIETARAHENGPEGFARTIAGQLLEEYLNVEEKFETDGRSTEQEVIDALRQVSSSVGAGPLSRPGRVVQAPALRVRLQGVSHLARELKRLDAQMGTPSSHITSDGLPRCTTRGIHLGLGWLVALFDLSAVN